MKEVAEELLRVVDAAEAGLRQVSESQSIKPVLRGGWSRKQVIGHLIDSTANNHVRFLLAALAGEVDIPGYDQDGNVRLQAVQEVPWELLVGLWVNYNRYLAHGIAHLPADKLEVRCRIGGEERGTLSFLVEDYLGHMKHHLEQIGLV